jgi:hypothetical protein
MAEKRTKIAIHGYVDSRLRDVIEALADKDDIALSDCVAALLAKAVGRPDLAEVPRKRMGRPRGKVEDGTEKGKGHGK